MKKVLIAIVLFIGLFMVTGVSGADFAVDAKPDITSIINNQSM